MILCHCAVVSDRDIRAAVEAGARTVGEVQRRTGAGSQCGGCALAVRACAHAALCQAGGSTGAVLSGGAGSAVALEVLDAAG